MKMLVGEIVRLFPGLSLGNVLNFDLETLDSITFWYRWVLSGTDGYCFIQTGYSNRYSYRDFFVAFNHYESVLRIFVFLFSTVVDICFWFPRNLLLRKRFSLRFYRLLFGNIGS